MREFEIITAEINQYLIKRSKNDDNDYQERLTHYEKFKQLYDAKAYADCLAHINAGILQFDTFSFSKKYYHYLLELKKIFAIENEKEKIQRQTQFIAAILSGDLSKIKTTLNQGGFAVIYATYQDADKSYAQFDEQSLLSIALTTNNQGVFEHLLHYVSPEKFNDFLLEDAVQSFLSNTQNPNLILNSDTQYSLLHYLAEHGLKDFLTDLIDSEKIDIDTQSKNGATALFCACNNNHTDLALKLMESGADVNLGMTHNNKFYSPLYCAVINNNIELAQNLIEHGAVMDTRAISRLEKKYHRNPQKYKAMHQLFKHPYRKNKETLYAKKATKVLFFDATFNAWDELQHNSQMLSNILMSQIYAHNLLIKELIIENLEVFCKEDTQTDNIIKPLLLIVAMGSMGLRGEIQNKKPIKAFINNQKDVSDLVLEASHSGVGCFTRKNSVFVAGKFLTHIFATLFHEWKHFVDKEVFGKTQQCFELTVQHAFDDVKADLYANFHTFPDGENQDSALFHIKHSFRSILYNDAYAKEVKTEEILTKVPEVIAYLGLKEGTAWLKKYTPSLYQFYKDVYNPMLKKYISERQSKAIADNTQRLSAQRQQNYWV